MPVTTSKHRLKPEPGRVAKWVAKARADWALSLLLILGLPLLWLDLFQPPIAPLTPNNLESSWYGALTHFAAQGLQFGRDVVFTYGPFGHLVSAVYVGELFFIRMAWELVSKTIFVGVIGFVLIRLPKFWRPIFFLFVLLFIRADGPADALYFLIVCCLALFLFREGPSSGTLNILAASLFAIFSLIKFTYFLLAIAALVLIAACHLKQQRKLHALWVSATFIASFLVCWWIARQEFSNLPAYLSTSLDISFGYKEAMALPTADRIIFLTGVTAALLGVVQCVLCLLDSRSPALLFTILFVIGETFVSWNRAFIRADSHVLSFYCLHPVVLATVWVVAQPKAPRRWAGYTMNLLVFLVCLVGFVRQQGLGQLVSSINETAHRIRLACEIVTDLPAFSEKFRVALDNIKKQHALPRVQAEVRDASIDVLGNEQGIAIVNNLHYTPRPIFQGYSAYTENLINLNTAFYSSLKAPAYVLSTLYKNQTIDNRYPTLDDAGVLKQLLFNYKPLLKEKGYVLWKRIRPAEKVQTVSSTDESLAINTEHAIPTNEMVWLELRLKQSFLGKLRSFFYKPPLVDLTVTGSSARQSSYRLIPAMATAGFIVSPRLATSRQLLRAASGMETLSNKSFRVDVSDEARSFFRPEILCRLGTLPSVPTTEFDEEGKQLSREVILEGQEASQVSFEQLFDRSETRLLRFDATTGFAGFSPLNKTTFAIDPRGVRVICDGSDPQVSLPTLGPGAQGGAIFRVDLDMPAPTSLQVFLLPGNDPVSAGRLLNQPLHAGENSVYFLATAVQLIGASVVVHTGITTGDYIIQSVEARGITPDLVQEQ
jgi:hypothetical protein